MTGSPFKAAFLQQISLNGAGVSASYPLNSETAVVIGRDPRCQIVLDSQIHGGVSRQHAKICLSADAHWQICDLTSANGTFVNGQRLQGCRLLQQGDRITLAQDAQFVFQLEAALVSPPPLWLDIDLDSESDSEPIYGSFSDTQRYEKRKPDLYKLPSSDPSEAVTFSQLFPIVSTGRDLTQKAYLIPGILTVAFVVMMFISVGDPLVFNLLLAVYIAGGAYYFIYLLCGKHKPWWLLVGTALTTVFLLTSPMLDLFVYIFREVLPGGIATDSASENFLILLMRMFLGAGLMEELLKALPVFMVYFWGTMLRSPRRERIGVWEPLDGILLGTASAVGFTLLETLGQYVPEIVNSVSLQSGQGAALGVQLLIPRVLGSIFGHMAYSGYFGYFIGLSVLKPRRRWQILAVGYLTAAALHALWNATGLINFFVLAVIGITSYAFLAAAILKARALSPTRSENFATRFSK
ncbi:MAG TPA: PrsW family glutamic-type intramembrane protease [Coleofasciculaceae cyanobacterium]|jgi:RsiW-degrading membrane proteinase PrsW (M82 family)